MKLNLKNQFGALKEVKLGFSWTMLFFGFFVPLFRGDWKWAVLAFLLPVPTCGVSLFVLPFFYNKWYIKDLIVKGWTPADDMSANVLKAKGLYSTRVIKTDFLSNTIISQNQSHISYIDYSSVDNDSLKAISSRFGNSKEDTVIAFTSRLCPRCSLYNRRVFSLWGRDSRFLLLPTFLHSAKCDECGCSIGFGHYFPDIAEDLARDITFSNRPFEDTRTKEEKDIWKERIKFNELNAKIEKDYQWIFENLPELCPKSLGGYKRMVNSKSTNYQKIVAAAKEKGYYI